MALFLACRHQPFHCVPTKERTLGYPFPFKVINPFMRLPMRRPHLTLNTSPRLNFHTPPPRWLALHHMNLRWTQFNQQQCYKIWTPTSSYAPLSFLICRFQTLQTLFGSRSTSYTFLPWHICMCFSFALKLFPQARVYGLSSSFVSLLKQPPLYCRPC